MACRIGITTDPESRKADWERKYPNLRNWRILETHQTKSQAQQAEDRLASQYGCEAHHGGGSDPGPWSVYKFDY